MYCKNPCVASRVTRRALLVGLPLLALTCAGPAFAQRSAPAHATEQSQVDQIFAQWNKPDSPGCAVAVKKAGSIVYKSGYGMADLDHHIPITPSTVFHAASLAKQFTAMSIMLLVDQKRLSLTEEVLIPELANINKNNPDRKKITLSDMLHHVSGIRDQWVLMTMAGWRLSDDVIKMDDVRNVIKRMKTLNFDPNTDFSYSNTNYTLASLIVERTSGKPLSEFARRNIFEPLGMTSTMIADTHGQIVKGRAYGYQSTDRGFEMRMPNYDLTGPTNLLTTVEDLMRWDHNFDAKIVGGTVALSAMQTPVASSNGFGLGLRISQENGRSVIEHDGRDPGYRAHLIRFPDEGLSVALLCNLVLPENMPTRLLVRKVAAIYLTHLRPEEPKTEPSGTASFTPAHSNEYVGRYYSDEIDTTYEIERVGVGTSLQLIRPRYAPMNLVPLSADKFRTVNFSTVLTEATLEFSRDAVGKINGFRIDDSSGNNRLTNFVFTRMR